VIGCGGGGGTGGGGTTTTGGNLVPPPTVTLPSNDASLQFTVVTGQGRRSPGEMIVGMGPTHPLRVSNGPFDVLIVSGPVGATLNSYSLYSVGTTKPIPAGTAQITYSEFPLWFNSLTGTDTNGNTFADWSGSFLAGTFEADVMLHRGRDTTFQFNLNDAIITGRDNNGPVFDVDIFNQENLNAISGKMESLFSDYVAFDLTAMAGTDRPNIIIGGADGGDCDMLLYSGDSIALSKGFDTTDTLMILDPRIQPFENVDTGQINSPIVVGGTPTEGTYTLFEPDWRLVDPTQGIIVSLQGRWRPYFQVLGNIGSYMMVIFPNSRDEDDGFTAVYIARNGSGQITAMWQGPARFSGPDANEIRLTRVKDIVSGLEINPAVGTLSGYTNSNGEITTGTFTFVAPPADFPFPLTGSFRVFRK
jgi:hypothetical protein